jgi:hypothetical protein
MGQEVELVNVDECPSTYLLNEIDISVTLRKIFGGGCVCVCVNVHM